MYCIFNLLVHYNYREVFVRKQGMQSSPSEAQQMLREKYLSLGSMRYTKEMPIPAFCNVQFPLSHSNTSSSTCIRK